MLQLSDKLRRGAEIAVGGRECWASVVSESQCELLLLEFRYAILPAPSLHTENCITVSTVLIWFGFSDVLKSAGRWGWVASVTQAAQLWSLPPSPAQLRALVSPGWGPAQTLGISDSIDYFVPYVTGKLPSWFNNVQKAVQHAFHKPGADHNVRGRTEKFQHRTFCSQ